MDEGEGGVGDADNFFTLYLSVNNNRSVPSSSHGPSCLRPDCGGGRLFSCRRTEVNAALAILKHVVRTPGERTGCGSGQPPPFKSPPCRWFRGESTPNLGGNRFRERYFSFTLLSAVRSPCPLRRVPRAKPREGAEQIRVAALFTSHAPSIPDRERAEQLSCRYDTDWTCGTHTRIERFPRHPPSVMAAQAAALSWLGFERLETSLVMI